MLFHLPKMYKCSVWRVFVPMFWECSFTHTEHAVEAGTVLQVVFVPMFGECSFTSKLCSGGYHISKVRFRPHVWGMFFHPSDWLTYISTLMIGFRPHVWGMFFHQIDSFLNRPDAAIQFSSPCLGNVLSQDTAYETAAVERFSSPCLGNLLSLWSYWG